MRAGQGNNVRYEVRSSLDFFLGGGWHTYAQGSRIYFTLDGSLPTESSTLFESPVLVREIGEVVVTARALHAGQVRLPPAQSVCVAEQRRAWWHRFVHKFTEALGLRLAHA